MSLRQTHRVLEGETDASVPKKRVCLLGPVKFQTI